MTFEWHLTPVTELQGEVALLNLNSQNGSPRQAPEHLLRAGTAISTTHLFSICSSVQASDKHFMQNRKKKDFLNLAFS